MNECPTGSCNERPTDACGVVGLYGVKNAASLAALGLHALQHRGQESAGVVTSYEGKLLCHKGMGLVAQVFANGDGARLPGVARIQSSFAIRTVVSRRTTA